MYMHVIKAQIAYIKYRTRLLTELKRPYMELFETELRKIEATQNYCNYCTEWLKERLGTDPIDPCHECKIGHHDDSEERQEAVENGVERETLYGDNHEKTPTPKIHSQTNTKCNSSRLQ